MVANFFIAAVDRLGPDPWDASLNLTEHVEFFLVMKERGLLSTSLSDVVVEHHPRLPPHYYDVRMRRARYEELWTKKRSLERKVFVGRAYTRRDRLVHYYPALVSYLARRVLEKTAARFSSPAERSPKPRHGQEN
jgi:hypothetical protein